MRRISTLFFLWLALLLVLAGPALAQGDPVRIDRTESYVIVLADGRLDVRYTLTFTELEAGRDRIRELGRFTQPNTIVSASGEGPDGPFDVTLHGGPEIYEVRFAARTQRNQQYEIEVRYTVDRSVFDATEIEGQPYRAIGWAPFEWELPIGEQIIEYVLPIELPPTVEQPEDVTDAIVNDAGLITEGGAQDPSRFDRWVYFPTPDEESGKVWLSVFVQQNNLRPRGQLVPKFYLPGEAITTTRETPIPLASPTPAWTPTPVPTGPLGLTREAMQLTCCVGVFVTIGVLIMLGLALRKRKPKLVYEPPEIQIETFQTPGVVPDLNAIETAFYLGN